MVFTLHLVDSNNVIITPIMSSIDQENPQCQGESFFSMALRIFHSCLIVASKDSVRAHSICRGSVICCY